MSEYICSTEKCWSLKNFVIKCVLKWDAYLNGCVCVLKWEATVMWPSKNISHNPRKSISHNPSSLVFFPISSPIKLKLGLQIGGRLLIANHLDQSLWLTSHNTKRDRLSNPVYYTLRGSQIIFITLYYAFYQALACSEKMPGQDHFAEPKWHVLTFLHPFLFCWVTYWTPLKLLKCSNLGDCMN